MSTDGVVEEVTRVQSKGMDPPIGKAAISDPIVAVLGLAVFLHPAVVVFVPPASVQGGSVYRPRSIVQGFPNSCRKLWAHKL
jgi:hypothetical protein